MTGRHIVLDVDDTLVDTFSSGLRKFGEVARSQNVAAPTAAAMAEVYGSRPFLDCVRYLFPTCDPHGIQSAYDSLAEDEGGQFSYAAIGAVSTGLRKAAEAGFRLGVLTNGTRAKTTRKLEALGDIPNLDFVITADDLAILKPSPSAFDSLREVGVTPECSWYVSDDPGDWRGARTAGYGVVGVFGGQRPVATSGEDAPDLGLVDLQSISDCLRPINEPISKRPRKVRGVSFDAGFTLIGHRRSPLDLAQRSTSYQAPDLNMSPESALAIPAVTWTSATEIERALRRVYSKLLGVCDGDAVVSTLLADYTSVQNWQALPGVHGAIARVINNNLPVGVLSNWQPNLPAVLENAGLAQDLSAVIASSVIAHAKPERAAFDAIADALTVKTQDLLHVGDDPINDAAGALSAGGRALLVDRPLTDPRLSKALGVMTS